MFILYTKINNEQKRTKKPKSGVQYEHIEHNVHSGHPVHLHTDDEQNFPFCNVKLLV